MANPCASTPQLLLLVVVVVGVFEPNKACLTRDTGISVPYYAALALQVVLGPQLLQHRHPCLTLWSRNSFGKLARSVNTEIR